MPAFDRYTFDRHRLMPFPASAPTETRTPNAWLKVVCVANYTIGAWFLRFLLAFSFHCFILLVIERLLPGSNRSLQRDRLADHTMLPQEPESPAWVTLSADPFGWRIYSPSRLFIGLTRVKVPLPRFERRYPGYDAGVLPLDESGVPPQGFEPWTAWLQIRCAAIAPERQIGSIRIELILDAYKTPALTIVLTPRARIGNRTRINCLEGSCVHPLHYTDNFCGVPCACTALLFNCIDRLFYGHNSSKEDWTPISALKGQRPVPIRRWSLIVAEAGLGPAYSWLWASWASITLHSAVENVWLEHLLPLPKRVCRPLHLVLDGYVFKPAALFYDGWHLIFPRRENNLPANPDHREYLKWPLFNELNSFQDSNLFISTMSRNFTDVIIPPLQWSFVSFFFFSPGACSGERDLGDSNSRPSD